MKYAAMPMWSAVHTVSSLACTAFLLMLCVTGLPLIFHHEIDELTRDYAVPTLPADAPPASLDDVVAAAQALHPSLVVQYALVDPDATDTRIVVLAPTRTATDDQRQVIVDARTAQVLSEPVTDSGFMYVVTMLHVELFAGLPGKLFLGAVSLLFVASIVSGVVVYAPFARKSPFGKVRGRSGSRLRWLDLHNVLGIATACWVLVVGFTGTINTLADLAIKLWQYDEVSEMTAPYRGQPELTAAEFGSVQRSVAAAQAVNPGMALSFVAFPGTIFTSPHHYGVFMHGSTAVASRLLKPALVDARTTQLTDSRDMPWYVAGLLLSQPLHFGDYGGLPLKILWATLDLVAIALLGSGLYLWVTRRRRERRAVSLTTSPDYAPLGKSIEAAP